LVRIEITPLTRNTWRQHSLLIELAKPPCAVGESATAARVRCKPRGASNWQWLSICERLELFQREIEAECALALATLRRFLSAPLLVTGKQKLDEVIADRLAGVPELLRTKARSRVQAVVVFQPWLTRRKVGSEEEVRHTRSEEALREHSTLPKELRIQVLFPRNTDREDALPAGIVAAAAQRPCSKGGRSNQQPLRSAAIALWMSADGTSPMELY
jgi:hypothetical protein